MTERELWVPTEATVTSCKYQFARMNTLTFGIQTGQRFRITFDYRAHGQLYSDEYQSPVAVPRNTKVPVSYNPMHPQENSLSEAEGGGGGRGLALPALGVLASVGIALFWLATMHGCR
jgi:hypothetical protein